MFKSTVLVMCSLVAGLTNATALQAQSKRETAQSEVAAVNKVASRAVRSAEAKILRESIGVAITGDGAVTTRPAAGFTIVYVDADAAGQNDGTSWSDAYNEIYDAMADPSIGVVDVQVWVADGVYLVAGTPARSDSLMLSNDTEYYGGFDGTEVAFGQRTIDPVNDHPTILTGDIVGNDGPNFVNRADNTYHVVYGVGVDDTSILNGFIIVDGNANGGADENNGGGLFLWNSDTLVQNCLIGSNEASSLGGGVYVIGGSPTFINSYPVSNRAVAGGGAAILGSNAMTTYFFSPQSNEATSFGGGLLIASNSDVTIDRMTLWFNTCSAGIGGGMYVESSSVVMSDVSARGNEASSGGGIYFSSATVADVVNSRFDQNVAAMGDGGGIYDFGSTSRLQNCLFGRNEADGNGGAVFRGFSALAARGPIPPEPHIANCTFYGNTASFTGGVFDDPGAGSTLILNSIVWGNSDSTGGGLTAQVSADVTYAYSIVKGHTGGGTGNLGADPLFVDVDGPDGFPGNVDDDFHLLVGSPAIDAGENDAILADFADLDGDMNTAEDTPYDLDDIARRKNDPDTVDIGSGTAPIVDMGAYEYFPDCNANGVPDGSEATPECVEWVGFCAEPGNEDFWTCFDNWDVPGDFYPDEDGSPGSIAGVSVTLPSGADVFLDEDVTVSWLYIKPGATLRVTNSTSPIGNLSFIDPAYLRIDGTLHVSADRTVGAPDDLVGTGNPQPMIVGPEGVYTTNPDPFLPGVTATAFAQDLFIEPGQCDPIARSGGSVALTESMGLRVSGQLHLIGSVPASCAIAGGVNPPPELKGFGNSVASSASSLVMTGAAVFELDGNAVLTVGGDFRNEMLAPELVEWSGGTVILTGLVSSQRFEAAGDDVGASNLGFGDASDSNFSMNRLEIAGAADVTFANDFRNVSGDGPCDEALYVDTLVFKSGAEVTIDDCKVYYRHPFFNGVTPNTLGCGALIQIGGGATAAPMPGDDTCFSGTTNSGLGCATDGDCTHEYESIAELNIPDGGGPALPVIDTIVITNDYTVSDVNVGVEIEHTWVGDLIITVEHNGRTATIVDRAGAPATSFGCSSNNYVIVLDDQGAGGSIENVCGANSDALTPTSPPNFVPIEPLSVFNGMNARGPWRVSISDNATEDVGKLVRWSLDLSNGGGRMCLGGVLPGAACDFDVDSPAGTCVGPVGGVCGSKSRYLEISVPGSVVAAGVAQTIKVTAVDVPPARYVEGDVWWAGPPVGLPNLPHADLTGAALLCTSTPTAFVIPPGSFYLYGGVVVPGSIYEIRQCDENGRNCSAGLHVGTAPWGDVVAGFGGPSQPNFADISALVDKFKEFASAPDTTRTDLVPGVPNQITNFADISADVDAFKNVLYPFSAATCP